MEPLQQIAGTPKTGSGLGVSSLIAVRAPKIMDFGRELTTVALISGVSRDQGLSDQD